VGECERGIVRQRWPWGVAEDVSRGRTGGGGAEGALLRGWLGVISLRWWCVAVQGLDAGRFRGKRHPPQKARSALTPPLRLDSFEMHQRCFSALGIVRLLHCTSLAISQNM
jgi:hypothetical protein